MNEHKQTLQTWLQTACGFRDYQLDPIAGDASFRCYFRLTHQGNTYMVMDASNERQSCVPFVAIANALRNLQVRTPEIIANDFAKGFLLLSDFGDQVYLKQLNTDNAKILYRNALDTLSILQGCNQISDWTVPHFTVEFMRQEMEWFKEWFVIRYLKRSEADANALNPYFDWLTATVGNQPYVFMHRDYHSANLMLLPDNVVGVLDFQDAFVGPMTYDLVSLLRDCYISWPESLVRELALYYLDLLREKNHLIMQPETFLFLFDCMSMQRHLKALITFSRKYIRDENANYLQHIPRTLDYLLKVSERYPESKSLNQFLTGATCAQ